MSREIELKLVIDNWDANKVLSTLGTRFPGAEFSTREMKNIYFDTPDLMLNNLQVALRIRAVKDVFIQTLKTKGSAKDGLHIRGEWEWPVDAECLNKEYLLACDAWPPEIDVDTLEPVFETNFTRTQACFVWGKSQIELALDDGMIGTGSAATLDVGVSLQDQAGLHNQLINELELELLHGDSKDLIGFGQALSEIIPVRPFDVSKAERGYEWYQENKA